MIRVYYAKVPVSLREDVFERCLQIVEEGRRKKILRIIDDREKLRSLTAGMLLHHALCRKLMLPNGEEKAFSIKYGERGKPFLTEYPKIHFNLSHSGDYVCCAVGEEPVGVDIQKQTAGKEKLAERFFTQKDQQKLSVCREAERDALFFRMWSIKESYIKFTGKGLRQGLSSFEIDWQRNALFEKDEPKPAAFFEEQDCLPGYSFCICFKNKEQEIAFTKVDRWIMTDDTKSVMI